mgnify:CR=1 FL=1
MLGGCTDLTQPVSGLRVNRRFVIVQHVQIISSVAVMGPNVHGWAIGEGGEWSGVLGDELAGWVKGRAGVLGGCS